MTQVTFLAALLMGFAGSLHCAGMCGPIMLFMPFQNFKGIRKTVAIVLYHIARISVYASMAAVLYSFRESFDPRIQQYISIVLGVTLLFAGLLSFFPSGKSFSVKLPWSEFVKKQLGNFIGKPSMGSIAISGMLNGLLPCGLVYMALSATLALPSLWQAVGFIYLFGAGTLPMLISITLLKNRVYFLRYDHFKKFVPIIVFSFGCLFVLRGLNLGIPYISPKVQASHGQVHSCCHKK